MAHYDCSNCGAHMGVCFGSCEECTPKEVFEANRKYNSQYHDAVSAWDKLIEKERAKFIAVRTAKAKAEVNRLYKKHNQREKF